MFDVYCPGHRARVLLGPRSIESMLTTDDGIAVNWRCPCGEHGTLVTGRRVRSAQAMNAKNITCVA